MKLKRVIAWLWIMVLPLISGCSETVSYKKELFKPDQDSCWPCKMYMQAFDAIQKAMNTALPIMCDNCLTLLVKVLFPIWILYKITPWLISFKEPDVKKDLKEIFIVSFKVLIVALLLSVKTGTTNYSNEYQIEFSSSNGQSRVMNVSLEKTEKDAGRSGVKIGSSSGNRVIYDVAGKMFLEPIGDIFLGISQLALATPSSVGISMSNYTEGSSGLGSTIGSIFKDLFDKVSDGAFSDNLSNIANKIQGLYTGEQIAEDPMLGKLPMKIQSIVWILYDALWSGMGLAFQLFQMNSIAAFFSGVLIFFALMAMMVKLPLAFVEAVLYIGITVLLLPLYLLYWIFPVSMSKDILKKLFHQLFSAFFDILFYCIYVAFLVSVLRIYIESDQSVAYLFSSDYQSQESGLREAAANMNTSFLIMTILIWTILKLFDHVTEYSAFFFDGAGQKSNIVQFLDRAKQMAYEAGKAAAKAVVGVATGNFAMAGKAVVDGAKNVGDEAQGMIRDSFNEAKDHGESREKSQAKGTYGNYE